MKTIFKVAFLGTCFVLMFLIDAPPQLTYPGLRLVPEAHAIFGVRRRMARRTAVVVGSAAAAETAAAQQQAAAAKQQAAAAPPPATGAALPLGTVVSALPAGCTPTTVGATEYYHCGANYYRAAFQGTQLVYMTAKP